MFFYSFLDKRISCIQIIYPLLVLFIHLKVLTYKKDEFFDGNIAECCFSIFRQ